MNGELIGFIETGDSPKALECLKTTAATGAEAWEAHLSLFPVVQRVLNPPFINPHLPKMYRICRELIPYLELEDIFPLVKLEVTEYARRPKLALLPRQAFMKARLGFDAIESAVRESDAAKTAMLMASFHDHEGGKEFARRLILLGSGYLDPSLGHSVSCTAFIVLEMLDREDGDLWPSFVALADYFCKGGFNRTPPLRKAKTPPAGDAGGHDLLRASSGRGIVNLHHTITRYAIERVRHLLTGREYAHLIGAWVDFMGDTKADEVNLGPVPSPPGDHPGFMKIFSRLDAESSVTSLGALVGSSEGRRHLGRFLVKGLADLYQGNYNPHYITGLGSALWVIENSEDQPSIAVNALYQYVDFLFEGLKA